MAKLLVLPSQKSASSATIDCTKTGSTLNSAPFEIFILSNSHLELIFSYLSFHELMGVRSVCRWFYFVVGAIMNRKLKYLTKEVEDELSAEKYRRHPSETRLKVMSVMISELRILDAHCLDYINGSMFYFYGGMILDMMDYILGQSASDQNADDVMKDVSELFMLVDRFLNVFDAVTEPVLLDRSYHLPFSWFGKKLLDVLDAYSCMEHFVAVEPLKDGAHIKWTGKYTAVPVHSLLPPPILVNTTEGAKQDMDSLLKFVRNHVRWNNILDIIKTSRDRDIPKRFEKRIHLEENHNCSESSTASKQRIISEKSFMGDDQSSDIRRLEINVGLFAHEIFAPTRFKELVEMLSNLGRSSEEDISSSYQSFLHVFYAELIVGLTSAVVAVQGVLVSQASLHNPLKTSTARAYKTWLILGIILVFSLTVALIVVPPAVEAGHNEILEIMKGGVSSYLRKLEWKMSLDKLHQQFRCCGVSSINDWYTSRWIPIRSFRPEVANLQAVLAEDGTLRARVVPASCCDPAVRLPCFHDTLQQNSSPADPRTVLRPETVFTRGCGALVVTPAASTVGPFKVLVITILLLQTGQLVIGRYLNVGTRSVAKCATVSENDRCCSRAKICLSPKRMICNDICSSETSRCSTVCRPRSKKSFCRKRTKTPSCAKSRVGKIGNVIRNVSRSMLCGLSRGSCKSSSGKGKNSQG